MKDKSIAVAIVLLAVGVFFAAGCATEPPAPEPAVVHVNVAFNGTLQANGMIISDIDLPAFVKELDGRPVNLVPTFDTSGGPTFTTMQAAQQKLKSAGISRVGISGISGIASNSGS